MIWQYQILHRDKGLQSGLQTHQLKWRLWPILHSSSPLFPREYNGLTPIFAGNGRKRLHRPIETEAETIAPPEKREDEDRGTQPSLNSKQNRLKIQAAHCDRRSGRETHWQKSGGEKLKPRAPGFEKHSLSSL